MLVDGCPKIVKKCGEDCCSIDGGDKEPCDCVMWCIFASCDACSSGQNRQCVDDPSVKSCSVVEDPRSWSVLEVSDDT